MLSPTSTRAPFDLSKYTNQYIRNLTTAGRDIPGAIPKPLTQSQQELVPYLQQEVQQEARKRGLLQPVEMIFDVLQRGQYLTANIVEKLVRNVRGGQPLLDGMPEAVKGALSGKVKGDWEVVLFGGRSPGGEQFEGIRPWEPATKGERAARKITGFLANVAADPLTYVGAGATTGAKAAAVRFSDDAVRGFGRRLGREAVDLFPDIIQKGIDPALLAKKAASSGAEAVSYLKKYAGEDVTRLMVRVKNDAYKLALRTPADQLTKMSFDTMYDDILGQFGRESTENIMKDLALRVPKEGDEFAAQFKKMIEAPRVEPPMQGRGWVSPPGTEQGFVKFDAEKMGAEAQKFLEYLGTNPYGAAGQRAWRIFRKEFNISERYPQWLQTMDKVKKNLNDSKIGGLFSDVWWAMMNSPKSPVANLRRIFHIRNPYQKMLSIMERDVIADSSHKMVLRGERVMGLFDELTDEERMAVTGAMLQSQVGQEVAKEQATKAAALKVGREFAGEPEELARMMRGEWVQEPVTQSARDIITTFVGDDANAASKLVGVVDEINKMTDEWLQYSRWAHENGFASSIGEWQDYLPIQSTSKTAWKKSGTSLGTAQPAFSKARDYGWTGHIRGQKEKIMWMFGLDEETASKMLAEGAGSLNMDIQDMLLRRAFAQTRFEQRINMIQQFQEFGVKLSDLELDQPMLYNQLVGKWGELEALGLKPMKGKGLEGYLFDREVTDILQRAIEVTSSDASMKALVKPFLSFTSWWRGWATLSPGFHARNYMSNNVTGFLKHGVEWLNPEVHLESFVATAIGLHGYDEGIKKLAKIIPEETVVRIANRRVGERTIAELAELAGGSGVITRMSRGYQRPETFDELKKTEGKVFDSLNLNPASLGFSGFKVSRNIGSYIESQAKFTSVLLDYRRAIGQGSADDTAFEFAKQEAKKWWIDYSDLSGAEQKIFRNVIPFYTWLRGNLSNQISGLMQFTEMYAMIPKVQQAVTMEGGPGREELPEWMRELGMLPIGKGEGGTQFFWPNFPYQDLNKIPLKFEFTDDGIPIPRLEMENTVSDILSNAHPILKTAVETATGIDLFYREELGETRRAPRLLRTPKLIEFLDGLLRTAGYKEGIRIDKDDKGRLLIDAKIGKILENNILPLRMLPQYMDLPELIFPVIEDWKKRAFGAVDDYEALEEFFQTLSFWGGIKLKELELEDKKFWENEALIKAAEAERSKDRRRMPGASQQRQDWIRGRQTTQRRLGL